MGEDALFRQRYSHKDEWKGIGMRLHHQPRPHSANHDAGSALRIRGLGMSLAYPVVDRWAGRWLGSDFDATLFDDRRHFRQLRISAASDQSQVALLSAPSASGSREGLKAEKVCRVRSRTVLEALCERAYFKSP